MPDQRPRHLDLVVRAHRAVAEGGERSLSLAVADGRIVGLGSRDQDWEHSGEELVLAADEVLLPGLVDTHVHVNEPGRTEWEGFASATRAAAAGGTTTVLDMPLNSVPATLDPASLAVKQDAARGQCWVDVGFWGGAVPSNAGSLATLLGAGVFGVKCFLLDSGVAEFPPLDERGLRAALAELAQVDGLLLVHAEDAAVVEAAAGAGGRRFADFVASRPPSAEAAAVRAVVRAAAGTGGRAHVVHLSSAAGLAEVAAGRAAGVRVTAETCPHYLALDAGSVPDGATEFKCCPPVRGRPEQEALWAGLLDGTLDCVVSDHSPCTADLKRSDTGDFAAAWGGIASLQVALPVVWTAARARGVPLSRVVGWMATATADLAGLADRGRLAVGAVADLVVLAPEEEFTVRAADLHHRNAVTPYEGHRLAGVVRGTWRRGRRIDLAAGVPQGEFLRPSVAGSSQPVVDRDGAGRTPGAADARTQGGRP